MNDFDYIKSLFSSLAAHKATGNIHNWKVNIDSDGNVEIYIIPIKTCELNIIGKVLNPKEGDFFHLDKITPNLGI